MHFNITEALDELCRSAEKKSLAANCMKCIPVQIQFPCGAVKCEADALPVLLDCATGAVTLLVLLCHWGCDFACVTECANALLVLCHCVPLVCPTGLCHCEPLCKCIACATD